MNQTQGRKEVKEAVVLAALCTLANGLVTWSLEKAKEQAAERKKKREEAAKARATEQNDVSDMTPKEESR